MTNRETVQEDALTIALQHKRCGLGISMGVYYLSIIKEAEP